MTTYRAQLKIEELFPPPEDKPWSNNARTVVSIEVEASSVHKAAEQISEHVNALVAWHEPLGADPA